MSRALLSAPPRCERCQRRTGGSFWMPDHRRARMRRLSSCGPVLSVLCFSARRFQRRPCGRPAVAARRRAAAATAAGKGAADSIGQDGQGGAQFARAERRSRPTIRCSSTALWRCPAPRRIPIPCRRSSPRRTPPTTSSSRWPTPSSCSRTSNAARSMRAQGSAGRTGLQRGRRRRAAVLGRAASRAERRRCPRARRPGTIDTP